MARSMTTARRARKSSSGYDLTRLIVGSEGTLGIITELTLKLHGIPEAISAGICPFPSVEAACNATILTIQSGIPVARIELLDALQVKACNAYSKLTLPETPMLLCEFHGSEASVAEQAQRFGEIAQELGGGPFDWATKAEDRNRLWQARHDGYWAARGLRPGRGGLATDVCVPISRLAECVTQTQEDVAKTGLIAPIVGHVGDGNFHLSLLIDMDDQNEVKRGEGVSGATGRARAGDGRHLHRRARRRAGQGEISAGRARRGGDVGHGRDQAGARSAQHHESGQDAAAASSRRKVLISSRKRGQLGSLSRMR